MSRETWEQVYRDAWTRYYSEEHVETLMRRAVASGLNRAKIVDALIGFSGALRIEGVHPLQFGMLRRKGRTQRRYGLPTVNPLVFYPWRAWGTLKAAASWIRLARRYRRLMARIAADPAAARYSDAALQATVGEPDRVVEAFADKIPRTHGAPSRAAIASA
jgi:hypothetical protein